MASSDSIREVIKSVLSQRDVYIAFNEYLQGKLEAARDRRHTGDFFTQAALLMKQQSRVDTISEIMAELTAIRDTREGD